MSGTQIVAERTGRKENKALMILSALGILFVVDEHLGRPISFLSQIFPYDSFYMPMFVFISGYFFQPKHCQSWKKTLHFAWNRCRKSLIPYLFWVLFYFIFTYVLRSLGVINFGTSSLKKVLYYMVSTGTTCGYNDASWFVPMLFSVGVLYCGIRRIFKKCWNDVAALFAFALIGAASVYLARSEFNVPYHYALLKAAFFMQFYHLGYFFRNRLEELFDKANGLWLCTVCVIVNIFLLAVYADHIRFPYCARMGGFATNNLLLPLITSVTGIAFWLNVSKVLSPVLGDSKLVNFISENTFFIMIHHLTAKALFNGLLIVGARLGIESFAAVNVTAFKASAWYIFAGATWVRILSFLFTVAVTLFACKLFLLVKRRSEELWKKKFIRRT